MRQINAQMEDFLSKQLQKAFEGGSIHTAEKDGKFYIIQDERALAGFLSQEDLQGLENDLFKVMEFETNSERSSYMSQRGWV